MTYDDKASVRDGFGLEGVSYLALCICGTSLGRQMAEIWGMGSGL